MERGCPSCGGVTFEQDASSGANACTSCGRIIDENAIVNEVAFGETSTGAAMVQGSFVSIDQTRARPSAIKKQNMLESREQTLLNGKRRILSLAHALKLTERMAESATRWFTLAVGNNFVQGRRSQYVVASCLYVVCRQEKTSHMLIDFADILQVNVFILGSTFLKLVRCLNLKLPIVDPSLYISRFAAMLEFGSETQKVASDAVRLVQRMDRDWIQQGRRPAGICGACLLIAARMNNFRRTMPEIIHVVKVADMTIHKRLSEFKSTASGDLTVEQFRKVWIETSNNPPSFDKTKRRKEIGVEKEEIKEQIDCEDSESVRIASEIQSVIERQDLKDASIATAEKKADNLEEDGLSDIDDKEIDSLLLTEKESKLKTMVWLQLNKDYLEQQELKQQHLEKEKKAGTVKQQRKRKKPNKKNQDAADMPQTPYESSKQMLQQRSFSKKINYAALEFLFNDK